MSLPASKQVELEAPTPQRGTNAGCQLVAGWLQMKRYQDEATTGVWERTTFLGKLHSSWENRTSHKPAKQSSFLFTISPSKIHHTKINMKLSYLLLPAVIPVIPCIATYYHSLKEWHSEGILFLFKHEAGKKGRLLF